MESLVRRTQWLTQGLILSGVLNVALLVVCLYNAISGGAIQTPVVVIEEPHSMGVVAEVRALPYEKLKGRLMSSDRFEREVALTALVERHHFDIGRALAGQPLAVRTIDGVTVFTDVKPEQHEALVLFAESEAWPLTSRGLFELLAEQGGDAEPTLVKAFTETLEFLAVDALFSAIPHEAVELIEIVTSSAWERLSAFAEEQRRTAVMADGQRRRFLLSYLELGSSVAAELLIRSDRDHLTDALSDEQLLSLVRAIGKSTPETGFLLVDLLLAPHSPELWQATGEKLYILAGEEVPAPYDHATALKRFVPEELLHTQALAPEIQTYVVQKGDSLWAIARDHQVSVNELRDANQLANDGIRPGQELVIPAEQGRIPQDAMART